MRHCLPVSMCGCSFHPLNTCKDALSICECVREAPAMASQVSMAACTHIASCAAPHASLFAPCVTRKFMSRCTPMVLHRHSCLCELAPFLQPLCVALPCRRKRGMSACDICHEAAHQPLRFPHRAGSAPRRHVRKPCLKFKGVSVICTPSCGDTGAAKPRPHVMHAGARRCRMCITAMLP